MKEVRRRARELMTGFCRVCPVCDGRACVGEVPGMGGIGTGASFQANVRALATRRFRMRTIHDVVEPRTAVTILGRTLSLPVLAAPIGGVSFNMGGKVSEPDYISAVISGCRQAGTIGCTGDGVPAFIIDSAVAAIKAVDGAALPFIKPWESEELAVKLAQVRAAGATMVGIDIDAAGLYTLRKMGRPVSPKTVEQLGRVIAGAGLPFVLKGIMTEDDARLAVDAGARGLVVSNHGGRVLDHTPGVAEVLPRVAAAVKGRIAILADGGIRTGGDVLKMLALGAEAVMIGRPLAVAAMGGLLEGVVKYLEQIRTELIQAMILTASPDAAQVDPDILV